MANVFMGIKKKLKKYCHKNNSLSVNIIDDVINPNNSVHYSEWEVGCHKHVDERSD